jgi:hypothetical protein
MSVGIATSHGLDTWGSIPGKGKRFFCSSQRPDRLWGSRSLLYNGYRGFYPGAVWPEREADRSPPCNSKVKNFGAMPLFPYTSLWREA